MDTQYQGKIHNRHMPGNKPDWRRGKIFNIRQKGDEREREGKEINVKL